MNCSLFYKLHTSQQWFVNKSLSQQLLIIAGSAAVGIILTQKTKEILTSHMKKTMLPSQRYGYSEYALRMLASVFMYLQAMGLLYRTFPA